MQWSKLKTKMEGFISEKLKIECKFILLLIENSMIAQEGFG